VFSHGITSGFQPDKQKASKDTDFSGTTTIKFSRNLTNKMFAPFLTYDQLQETDSQASKQAS